MSRRQTVDYVSVFKELASLMHGEQKVENVVIDFEQAAWIALREVFQKFKTMAASFTIFKAYFVEFRNWA